MREVSLLLFWRFEPFVVALLKIGRDSSLLAGSSSALSGGSKRLL